MQAWLLEQAVFQPELSQLRKRTAELIQLGLKNVDALHVATAEQAKADALATCDDRLLHFGRREAGRLRLRIIGVVELTQEVLK